MMITLVFTVLLIVQHVHGINLVTNYNVKLVMTYPKSLTMENVNKRMFGILMKQKQNHLLILDVVNLILH